MLSKVVLKRCGALCAPHLTLRGPSPVSGNLELFSFCDAQFILTKRKKTAKHYCLCSKGTFWQQGLWGLGKGEDHWAVSEDKNTTPFVNWLYFAEMGSSTAGGLDPLTASHFFHWGLNLHCRKGAGSPAKAPPTGGGRYRPGDSGGFVYHVVDASV